MTVVPDARPIPAGPGWRVGLLAAGLLLGLVVGRSTGPDPSLLVVFLISGALAAAVILGGNRVPAAARLDRAAVAIGGLAVVGYLFGSILGILVDYRRVVPGPVIQLLVVVLAVAAVVAVLAPPPADRFGFALLLLTQLIVVALYVHEIRPRLDVWGFQHDAVAALLHGHNPYTMTFRNLYGPEATRMFYAPGLVVAGRVMVGFPYPPLSLLLAVPGYLLGDIRYSGLVLMSAAAAAAWVWAPDRIGRIAAVLLLIIPGRWYLLWGGWTETLVIGMVALVVHLGLRRHPWLPYALGLLLVSKQYFVVLLPVVLLLAPRTPEGDLDRLRLRGFLARTVLGGAVVTLPFVLWGVRGFLDSVVAFQFRQPFRPDSESLLVWSVLRFGWPPPSSYGVLPLLVGVAVAVLCAWRAPRTPAGFAAATGLCLMVTALLSKQAFGNYYLLTLAAFLIAVAAAGPPVTAAGGEP